MFKGQQLNIFPKVFREDKDDNETDDLSLSHLMKNLVQWLQYCNKIDYPFISISSELEDSKDLKELFITLYLHYVKQALDYGPFYRYEEKHEELGVIKGHIDFKDYINHKIPNGLNNRFLCSFSEFEFDNVVNRIPCSKNWLCIICATLRKKDNSEQKNDKTHLHLINIVKRQEPLKQKVFQSLSGSCWVPKKITDFDTNTMISAVSARVSDTPSPEKTEDHCNLLTMSYLYMASLLSIAESMYFPMFFVKSANGTNEQKESTSASYTPGLGFFL